MNVRDVEPRYPTRAAMESLEQKLRLQVSPHMQDWEIQLADETRLGEFLDLYETNTLDPDEKFTLMALIIASFDDWLASGQRAEVFGERIERALVADFSIHASTVVYWGVLDPEQTAVDGFEVTPWMKRVWDKISSAGELG
jgi:hypothetical protein